jgi:transcriptional regulator GlxA family with amidase domain
VVAVIDRHLDTPLRVADLARRMNLSPSRLSHLFRTECGCGPGAYVRGRRLARAHGLLVETTLSVKEVMSAVGVSDPSHFARDFKRRFGQSPTTLRARLHGGVREMAERRAAVE